jgi:hypothetical protein
MVVASVLFLSIAACAGLFVAQRKRDKENAEDTARLRARGIDWSDWFESREPERRRRPTANGDDV